MSPMSDAGTSPFFNSPPRDSAPPRANDTNSARQSSTFPKKDYGDSPTLEPEDEDIAITPRGHGQEPTIPETQEKEPDGIKPSIPESKFSPPLPTSPTFKRPTSPKSRNASRVRQPIEQQPPALIDQTVAMKKPIKTQRSEQELSASTLRGLSQESALPKAQEPESTRLALEIPKPQHTKSPLWHLNNQDNVLTPRGRTLQRSFPEPEESKYALFASSPSPLQQSDSPTQILDNAAPASYPAPTEQLDATIQEQVNQEFVSNSKDIMQVSGSDPRLETYSPLQSTFVAQRNGFDSAPREQVTVLAQESLGQETASTPGDVTQEPGSKPHLERNSLPQPAFVAPPDGFESSFTRNSLGPRSKYTSPRPRSAYW